MRFIFATLTTSLIAWLLWPWIKQFLNYLKTKYEEIKPNADKVSEQSQNEQQTSSTKEANDETD